MQGVTKTIEIIWSSNWKLRWPHWITSSQFFQCFYCCYYRRKRKHCKPTHNHAKRQYQFKDFNSKFRSQTDCRERIWQFSISFQLEKWEQNRTEPNKNRSLLLFELGQLLIGTIVVWKLKNLFWWTKCQAYNLTNKTKIFFQFLRKLFCSSFEIVPWNFVIWKSWFDNKTETKIEQTIFIPGCEFRKRFGWISIWAIDIFANFDGFIILIVGSVLPVSTLENFFWAKGLHKTMIILHLPFTEWVGVWENKEKKWKIKSCFWLTWHQMSQTYQFVWQNTKQWPFSVVYSNKISLLVWLKVWYSPLWYTVCCMLHGMTNINKMFQFYFFIFDRRKEKNFLIWQSIVCLSCI